MAGLVGGAVICDIFGAHHGTAVALWFVYRRAEFLHVDGDSGDMGSDSMVFISASIANASDLFLARMA